MQQLRKPKIDGRTPQEQIEQLKRALFTLIDDLNYVLASLEQSQINNNTGG